jgi:hypothetical protein
MASETSPEERQSEKQIMTKKSFASYIKINKNEKITGESLDSKTSLLLLKK